MMNDRAAVLDRIGPTDVVLDIGAWNDIFPRADWIIDLAPYETRRNHTGEPENFSADTWVIGDVNSPEVWSRFPDKFFDYVICSHLLEDVRDPIFVCRQLNRVARRGYIEVPTRFRECARSHPLETGSGYDHHRWIVDVVDGDLAFTAKLHWASTIDYLPPALRPHFHDFKVQFISYFWEDSFGFHERIPKGELNEGANILFYYDTFDVVAFSNLHEIRDGQAHSAVPVGATLWTSEFLLPMEEAGVAERYWRLYEDRLLAIGMAPTRQRTDVQLPAVTPPAAPRRRLVDRLRRPRPAAEPVRSAD